MSSLADAIAAAKATLLAGASFSARVLAHGGTAVTHVHLDRLADPDGLADHRPYALLRVASRGSNPIAEGIDLSLTVGGGILLLLEDTARETSTHEASYVNFITWIGDVIDELEDLSGRDDYLPFKSELIYAPQRVQRGHQTADNDYWTAVYLLNWGDQVM